MEPATFTAVQTYFPASSGTVFSMCKLPSLLRKTLPLGWTWAGKNITGITQERYDNKVCWVAFSWKSWSPLQVFHLGTSIFPEVVFHPAAYRECLETGRCPWWWPGLLGPREAALQEDLIETQTLKNDQEDLEQFVACAIISEMCNEMAEESIPRPVTLILASVWMLPNLFLASQMYVPSSSSQTPLVKHTGSKQREELMSP